MMPVRRLQLLLLLPALLSHPAAAQSLSPSSYACRFVEVPVRDGVHLHTSICAPRDSQDRLPFLLTRTPYGIAGDTVVSDDYRFLAADGYIFVSQDIRGRYGSEGQFLMNRPLHDPADSTGVDESTDTYDTVEWLLKNVPNNNGRVGVLGVSYPGLPRDHGRHQPAPRGQGDLAPGADDRHLDGRRLLPPGRIPAVATASSTAPTSS